MPELSETCGIDDANVARADDRDIADGGSPQRVSREPREGAFEVCCLRVERRLSEVGSLREHGNQYEDPLVIEPGDPVDDKTKT